MEADICHRIVETTGARMFGIEDVELQERKKYVMHVRRELEVGYPSCWALYTDF